MEIKIRNRLVEIRRFENVMTIVLQIVRPVDGLTCCVSTLNFAAVHRSVLVTKRYLLSMLVVKSKMIIERWRWWRWWIWTTLIAWGLQPSSRCFVTLCCEPANSWTWQAPAQTNILFVFGVFVLFCIDCVLTKWAMYQTAAQTNILAGQNR